MVQKRIDGAQTQCLVVAARPEGAGDQWRKIPLGELSMDAEADERLGWVTGQANNNDERQRSK